MKTAVNMPLKACLLFISRISMSDSSQKLSNQPINSLFFSMLMPITFGLLINGLYTLVDAYFVTHYVGSDALGGIGIIFPLQMLMFAFVAMIGAGAASVIARQLGAQNKKDAQFTLSQANNMALIVGVLGAGIFTLCLPKLLNLMGTSASLKPWAHSYGIIIFSAMPITIFAGIIGDLLRGEGKAGLMAAVMLLASLLNIVFDALFIVYFEWQVQGAAAATVLAQVISLIVGLSFYWRGKTFLRFSFKAFTFSKTDRRVQTDIVLTGFPTMVSNLGVAVMIALTIYSLSVWAQGDVALAQSAYSLLGRVFIFMILPLIAIMIACQTLVGFNYGAQQFDRVRGLLKLSLITASVYSLSVCLFMVFLPDMILSLFSEDADLIDTASRFSTLLFLGYCTVGISFVGQGFFQSIGKAKIALSLTMIHNFLILVPLILILPYFWGEIGLWVAFPVSDLLSMMVIVYFLVRETKVMKPLKSKHKTQLE
jgi:putative MATE family efflux protein